jgi:hypothetical protein
MTHMFVVVLHVAVPLFGGAQSASVQQPVAGMQVEPHFL